MRFSDDLRALIKQKEKDEFSYPPEPGQNGYPRPTCIECPNLQYTEEALLHQVSGTIVLDITVGCRRTRKRHQAHGGPTLRVD